LSEHEYPAKTDVPGPEILKDQIRDARNSIRDLVLTVEDIVESGDTVWARSMATGSDPRSGKAVAIYVVDICRFENGKLVEHWGVPDRFALLHQIGALSYRFLKSFVPSPSDPEVMAWLKGRIDAAFAIVDKHLAMRSFVVAERPTVADFSMAGYLFYPAEESGYVLRDTHPNIARWLERVQSIPGWADPYDLLPGIRIKPFH
jgi:hypothetical protein